MLREVARFCGNYKLSTRGCDIFWENVRFGSAERSVKSGVRSYRSYSKHECEAQVGLQFDLDRKICSVGPKPNTVGVRSFLGSSEFGIAI